MTDRNQNGCILAFRNDRLGGRLNAILIAMRLARTYDAPFRIFWAVSDNSSPELQQPGDLFSKAFIAKHFTTREEGSTLLRQAQDISTLPSQLSQEDFCNNLKSGKIYLSNAATTQTLMPWEDAAELAVLPTLLAGIGFNSVVRKVIRQIDKKLSGLSFKSYHLRRGDIIDDGSLASHNLWPDKYIPRVIYERHMKRELERGEEMLVVFSDAPQETSAFAALSPRISSFDDLVGNVTLKPLQRDFLELYTMSRSSAIFAPPSSAFSSIAALLGNRQVTDITTDLSSADYGSAMDELIQRLENGPRLFLGQSDAGQNLPFIARHLAFRGEDSRTTAIAMNLVQQGMDRAYAYSFLSERLLAEGNYDGCDQMIEMLGQRLCHREEHFSTVFQHGALADMARGNWERALQRFHSGSWYFPINRLTTESFYYLTSRGLARSTDMHPYDPLLMRQAGRIYNESASPTHRLLMQQLRDSDAQLLQYPANLEVRDWRRLHGKKLNFRFSHEAKLVQQAEMIEKGLTKAQGLRRAALTSAAGALWAEAGMTERAEPMLKSAIEANPDQPLYHKRHADLLLATDRSEEAIAVLEQALALSGGNPCYQAELALAYLSEKMTDRYIKLMTAIDLSDIPMAELHLLQIDAARRDPNLLPDLPASLSRLERMIPNTHRLLAVKSLIFSQLEDWDEALICLVKMQRIGRPEAVLRPRMTRLFKSYRAAHDERRAAGWLAAHGVDPDLVADRAS